MKVTRFFVVFTLSLALIITTLYPVCAGDEKIAFSSNRKGNWDIYVMDTDGSDQVRLTNNRGIDVSPVWSPTSEQILFSSDRDGIRDLYVMDADGGRLRKVFRDTAMRIEPAWAPDGERIVLPRRIAPMEHPNGDDTRERCKTGGFGRPAWRESVVVPRWNRNRFC